MRKNLKTIARCALAAALLLSHAIIAMAVPPTAASFSTAVPLNAQSVIQLQGADADGTPLTYAVVASPAHGISNLNTSTGALIYTPTADFIGADSFTYTVTSGGETTPAATVSLTITAAKTRVIDTLTCGGVPCSGTVSFFLTQVAASPSGIIPAKASVSSVLSSNGQFDVSLYPSRAVSPVQFYQMWLNSNGNSQLLGIYDIPASTTTISLIGHRITDANLSAQYTFASKAEVDALTQAVANAVLASSLTGAQVVAALGYTPVNPSTLGTMANQSSSAINVTGGDLYNVNCHGCVGGVSGSGGVSNPDTTVLEAGNNGDAVGYIDERINGVTKRKLNNDGTTALVGGLEAFAKSSLPSPCSDGRIARVNDDIRGVWRCTGNAWVSLTDTANIRDFGASGDSTTTTGTATSGNLSLPVSSASSFKAGQGILIVGAGTAGADYLGTIFSVSGNTVTLTTPAPATTVASARVKHDDSAAVNAASVAARSAGVGTVFAPRGTYPVSAVWIQNTDGEVSQQSVTIQGEGNPPQYVGTTLHTANIPNGGGTVFIANASSGTNFGGNNGGDFTKVTVTFRDITVRCPDDPPANAINASKYLGLMLDRVYVDTGRYTSSVVQPTHGIKAIITPANAGGSYAIIRDSAVQGFDTCWDLGEHVTSEGQNQAYACNVGIQLEAATHDLHLGGRWEVADFGRAIKVNGPVQFRFENLDLEYGDSATTGMPAWMNPLYALDDGSNQGRGIINFSAGAPFSGTLQDKWLENGGFYVWVANINRVDGLEDSQFVGATLSASQSIPDSTLTAVQWDTNTGGSQFASSLHSTSTSNHLFKCYKAGTVTISVAGEFAANATGVRQMRIYKNGSGAGDGTLIGKQQFPAASSGGTPFTVTLQGVCGAPTDTFVVSVYQNSTAALNFSTTSQAGLPLVTFKITP